MTGKCEICEETAELTKVSSCACDANAPHAFLCEDCKKKYFDYMTASLSGIFSYLPSVPYIPNHSYAWNLVYAYNMRFSGKEFDHKEIARIINEPEKEEPTMQVECNGFTGELVKLERQPTGKYKLSPYDRDKHPIFAYDLSIYDCENQATYSFTGVKLVNIKFLGGAVSFGG